MERRPVMALGAVVILPVKDRRRAALAVGKISLISVAAFLVGALLTAVGGGLKSVF